MAEKRTGWQQATLSITVALFIITTSIDYCRAANLGEECDKMFSRIPMDKKVALLDIWEREFGNLTEFGNLWRDRIEGDLANRGLTVLPRQEIGVIADDMGMFDNGDIDWDQLKADVAVTGKYYLPPAANSQETVQLSIKALLNGNHLLGSCEATLPMQPGWERLATRITGNVNPTDSRGNGPALSARLDRDPACYPDLSSMTVTVNTEAGTWLYLLSIAYDGAVTRIYPNKTMKELPLVAPEFVFPPQSIVEDMGLYVKGMDGQRLSNEAIVVIASAHKLDLAGIPELWEANPAGVAPSGRRDLEDILRNSSDITRENLTYTVGPGCGPTLSGGFM